jgi:hypothetical protein
MDAVEELLQSRRSFLHGIENFLRWMGSVGSEVLRQAEGIDHRKRVAGRDGIPDPKELKFAVRVAGSRLWLPGDEVVMIHCAQVARQPFPVSIRRN